MLSSRSCIWLGASVDGEQFCVVIVFKRISESGIFWTFNKCFISGSIWIDDIGVSYVIIFGYLRSKLLSMSFDFATEVRLLTGTRNCLPLNHQNNQNLPFCITKHHYYCLTMNCYRHKSGKSTSPLNHKTKPNCTQTIVVNHVLIATEASS